MADTVSKKFVNSAVVHTPTGFFVANAGETKEVPKTLVERLTRDGAFGKAEAEKAAVADAPDDLTAQFNAGAYRVVKGNRIGDYVISGLGLAEPETVRSKADAQKRLDELNEALVAGGNTGAPTE